MGEDEMSDIGLNLSGSWRKATLPLTIPVAYLSRLQRILPAARWELRFKAAHTALPPHELHQRHVPWGPKSRHRRIKKQRRYERLAATSQLSLWNFSDTLASNSEDVPPQPNSPPDNVFRPDGPNNGPWVKRGAVPRFRFTE
ncbi:hypothetical protein Dsin_032632 [Dipteronia sinensis]|uniref:Uncharacterized protein n=1 Tax=Dipteronia sinensis TaxID=43782 RepID=A0AAD9Z692_9ROSI|nr:hypothetical protein Dsin_032632 [Dipteronia sinensis]